MINKKGFTTIELILTMSIVMVIMATITSVTYTYRDRSVYEESITKLSTYKNSITKIIYDDILDIHDNIGDSYGKVIKLEEVDSKNYRLITETNNVYNLSVLSNDNKVGIKYGLQDNEIEYIIPISTVIYEKTVMYPEVIDENNKIQGLDIFFYDKSTEEEIKIHFIISE